MTRCSHVQRWASQYLDGDLDDARAGALRGHLRTCESCRRHLDDLAALINAASTLEPPEPPASLWSAIEHGLAAAEMTDARRSWLWLHWQSLRSRMLPAAVAAAALALAVVWLERRVVLPRQARMPTTAPAAASPTTPSHPAAPGMATPASTPVESFVEVHAREVRAADQRYQATIDELMAIVDEERHTWPDDTRKAFDERLQTFRSAAQRHALSLAVHEEPEPRNRDALYTVYQAEIEFLQEAALFGPTSDAAGVALVPGGRL